MTTKTLDNLIDKCHSHTAANNFSHTSVTSHPETA